MWYYMVLRSDLEQNVCYRGYGTMSGLWIKTLFPDEDPEGKHRLWIFPEWRTIVSCWDMDKSCGGSSWLPNIMTLQLECTNGAVIIMFWLECLNLSTTSVPLVSVRVYNSIFCASHCGFTVLCFHHIT